MRKQIDVVPMQWATIKQLEEIEPLNDGDSECMRDLKEVLVKHNKIGRFGIHLIHKHFDLQDDEILCESIDVKNRVLTMQPKKRAELSDHVETMWSFRDGNSLRSDGSCSWDREHQIHMSS